MPPLTEKTLAPETVTGILDDAENLAEDKLSVLEHFLASLNLPENALADLGDGALALAASFLAALGIDLDLDTTNTPLKPAGTEQASFHIRRVPKEETECAAAPAGEAPEDLSAVFNKVPDDYHGARPDGTVESAFFEELWKMDCDDVWAIASDKEPTSRFDPQLDFKLKRMAQDVLRYRRNNGLCRGS